jgi:UDP-N-acetylglucosamine 2-epimerase (non-hydrolysing)/GDP/UDP-N,N'-diacetylbacillosamine 2-epimerase (hydrolysing)
MRRIVSITGSRADYGLMEPVHRVISNDPSLDLHLIVTGMHYLPEFASSLEEVRSDKLGTLHEVAVAADGDSAIAMVKAVGAAMPRFAELFARIEPDVLLLQGDRGEMLAGAIAGAHMNIATVHMSGGDYSGSIDDSVRNAISKLAHFHLTNCRQSSERLRAIGEMPSRIFEVGEPGLDRLLQLDFVPIDILRKELHLPADSPFLVATLHPVTDEADAAAQQMRTLLEALELVAMPVVFTHPNSDHGGKAMREELESRRGKDFLRIVPSLGSRRYLSLLRHAAAVVGNSSSGLFDTPTLKIPAINIGSRQSGRVRAANVVDVDFDKPAIVNAIRHVISDPEYRKKLAGCSNPYGDGHAAERTLDVLKRLRLGRDLVAKWRNASGPFLDQSRHAV